jgi:hypothetical protein
LDKAVEREGANVVGKEHDQEVPPHNFAAHVGINKFPYWKVNHHFLCKFAEKQKCNKEGTYQEEIFRQVLFQKIGKVDYIWRPFWREARLC